MPLTVPPSMPNADHPPIEEILKTVIAGYAHLGVTYEGITDQQRYDRATTRARLAIAALFYGFGYTAHDLARVLHASPRTAYRYLERAAEEMTRTSDMRDAVDYFYRILVQRHQVFHEDDDITPSRRIRGIMK
jgi:hypothetical protein